MRRLRLVPDDTDFRFMQRRTAAFLFTFVITLAAVLSLALQGLNLGVDYAGGILVEARALRSFDLAALRSQLATLNLGEVVLQTFGGGQDVMIRFQEQPGGPDAQQQAIVALKSLLGSAFEIRRSEYIGPQVSQELLLQGLFAAVLAVILIGVYVWFRFEWQFGLAAVVTTFHDVIATVGLFSVFQLEFNLTILAALLTIAGYSINDTVVVFDRIRENLRVYKRMPLQRLIDISVNQTLARTLMTSGTTLLAIVALLLFGGPVLRNFSLALLWGLIIGTYSSIFVASALLLHLPSLRRNETADAALPVTPTSEPPERQAP